MMKARTICAAIAALSSMPEGWRIKKNVTGENTAINYSLVKDGFVFMLR